MKAIAKNVDMKPRKGSLVASLVRGKGVVQASLILKGNSSKAAKLISKTLLSAVANAENNSGSRRDELMICDLQISRGTHLKRSRSANKGQRHPKRVYRANVRVGLCTRESKKAENTNVGSTS